MTQGTRDALADAATLALARGEGGNLDTDHAVRTRGALARGWDSAVWMAQAAAHSAFRAVPGLRGEQ